MGGGKGNVLRVGSVLLAKDDEGIQIRLQLSEVGQVQHLQDDRDPIDQPV
jgi:hypothetical protein